jgi:hypothetical protein
VLFLVVVAPVERRLGSPRMLGAFAAGHVGARDVGVSYGFFGVAGLAGYLLAPRARVFYFASLLGYVVVAAVLSHTFTDFGHLAAVGIGLACYPLARTSMCTGRDHLAGGVALTQARDPFRYSVGR